MMAVSHLLNQVWNHPTSSFLLLVPIELICKMLLKSYQLEDSLINCLRQVASGCLHLSKQVKKKQHDVSTALILL